jgi:coatomer subunit beta'
MVGRVAESGEKAGKNNVAFTAHFLLGHLEHCLNILVNTDRLPEAAFFAR